MLHVQRRHHHHRRPSRRGRRPGRRPPTASTGRARTAASVRRRAPHDVPLVGSTGRRRRRPLAGEQQRVRAQQARRRRAPPRACRRAERERPGQLRDAEPRRRTAGRARSGSARATAPMVVAQTTVDSARARRSVGARSVAAYRAPLLAAVAEPSSDGADQQQHHRVDDAGDHGEQRARGAEQVARRQARPGGRARDISRASRNDATAAPSTWNVCARPGLLLRAGDVAGQQRGGGDADRDARPRRRPGRRPGCATVRRWAGRRGTGRGQRGHRSRGGSSRAAQTARPDLLGRHAGVERLGGGAAAEARPSRTGSAQARAYAGPRASSIRAQNSVCLTAVTLGSRADSGVADVPDVVDDVVQVVAPQRVDRELAAVAAEAAARPASSSSTTAVVRRRDRRGRRPRPRRRPRPGPARRTAPRPRSRPGPSSRTAGRPRRASAASRRSKIRCTSRTWQAYSSGDQTAGSGRCRAPRRWRARPPRPRRWRGCVRPRSPRPTSGRRSRTRGTARAAPRSSPWCRARSCSRSSGHA